MERAARLTRRAFVRSGLAAAVAPVIPACGAGATGARRSVSARLGARPGVPSREPTPGVSDLGLGGGRDGLLYVPDAYDDSRPWPLFVALHGAGSDADAWRGFLDSADDWGMVIVVPESRGRTWDIVHGTFGPDVVFVDRTLEHTFERCRIDPARSCLGGFSDGASYALSLGLSNGDLFSHLVAFSPGFSAPDRPLGLPRVWASHGADDPVLPLAATRDIIVPALRARGHDVTFREYAGGHSVPPTVAREALDWFLPAAPGFESGTRSPG